MELPNDAARSVFINCPLEKEYEPLLEAMLFCVVHFGFIPRLASERRENGESRLDKIVELIGQCKYSIHDLSRCKSTAVGEFSRMNMPFELGIDMGFRRVPNPPVSEKKFLIFESERYDLKRALSDLAGTDAEYHEDNYQKVMGKVRDFFASEANLSLPGLAKIQTDYASFQEWMIESKMATGHSFENILSISTKERLDAMKEWVAANRP